MRPQEIIRMADHKLFAEIVHAMLNGVRTTNSRMLDSMYRTYESGDIPGNEELLQAIDSACSRILGWRILCETSLVQRSHIFYSLMLAIISVEHKLPSLLQEHISYSSNAIHPNCEQNLLALSDALVSADESTPFGPFLKASSEKTNTKDQRQTRIEWLARALTEPNW